MKIKRAHWLLMAFLCTFLLFGNSCNRGPSCPAYKKADPNRKGMYTQGQNANNKKDVKRRRNQELKAQRKAARRKGKNSYNLFPKHMRKGRR